MDVRFTRNSALAVDTPHQTVEGVTLYIKTHWWDEVTAATVVAYRRKTDVTSTVFPSGSIVYRNNMVILKPMTNLVGGRTYVIAITGTINGSARIRKILLQVARDEAWQ